MSLPSEHWAHELQQHPQTSPLTAAEYALLDEWYSLDRATMSYAHMRTFMRDAGDRLEFDVPVRIKLGWDELLP